MRRYRGFIADSDRWSRFVRRDGDVLITTPSKCGTTWMQTIVGMLLFGRVDIGRPMGLVSPWLDMLIKPEAEVFDLLAAQTHRRFIKTHTPLDGLPDDDGITFIAVMRHPLDAALSNQDHLKNMRMDRTFEMRAAASGIDDLAELPPPRLQPGGDPGDDLRSWIASDEPGTGTGGVSLLDLAHQARTYFDARSRPNVHLFHYADLERDLDGEMRRVAAALEVDVDAIPFDEIVAAAGFDAMRSRADDLVPDAHLDLWESSAGFFAAGGRRDWTALLSAEDVTTYGRRLVDLAGPDTARWMHEGRSALT